MRPTRWLIQSLKAWRTRSSVVELVVLDEPVPAQVLVHAAEVAPVVGQDERQLETACAGFVEHPVEPLEAVGSVIVGGALKLIPILKVGAFFVPGLANVRDTAIERAAVEEGSHPEYAELHLHREVEHVQGSFLGFVGQVVVVCARKAEGHPVLDEVGAGFSRVRSTSMGSKCSVCAASVPLAGGAVAGPLARGAQADAAKSSAPSAQDWARDGLTQRLNHAASVPATTGKDHSRCS